VVAKETLNGLLGRVEVHPVQISIYVVIRVVPVRGIANLLMVLVEMVVVLLGLGAVVGR
jgi:hypothetical protein